VLAAGAEVGTRLNAIRCGNKTMLQVSQRLVRMVALCASEASAKGRSRTAASVTARVRRSQPAPPIDAP
jgi:hypothetical protein